MMIIIIIIKYVTRAPINCDNYQFSGNFPGGNSRAFDAWTYHINLCRYLIFVNEPVLYLEYVCISVYTCTREYFTKIYTVYLRIPAKTGVKICFEIFIIIRHGTWTCIVVVDECARKHGYQFSIWLESENCYWKRVRRVISFNVRTPCKINVGYTSEYISTQWRAEKRKTNTVLLF
jgi:hypothetical protein